MSIIASDTFTGAVPTNLTSHVSDSGHTWAASPGSGGSFVIDSYTLPLSGGTHQSVACPTQNVTAEAIISCIAGNADYTVTVDVRVDGDNVFDFPGAMFRAATGVDTTYRAFLNSGGSGLAGVFTDKVIAGTESQIGSQSSSVVIHSGDLLRLVVGISGTAISIALNNITSPDGITQNLSDASISAIGQAGILIQQQNAGTFHQVITAFSVDGTPGGGGQSGPVADDTWPDMLGRPQAQTPTVTVFA